MPCRPLFDQTRRKCIGIGATVPLAWLLLNGRRKTFMNNNTNNTLFLPTVSEWARMYTQWFEKMSRSLFNHGGPLECREAVHEAFLKAMGLSDRLHLRDELTAKTEDCWYGFLRNQAKGILSHRHAAAKRFVEYKEQVLAEETFAEDDWGDVDNSDALAVRSVAFASDRSWLKKEVRRTVEDVCRKAGVSERNIRAFFRFVLDEAAGKTVVGEIPSLKNANNLYQIRDRVAKLLKASAERFEGLYDELIAA